MTTRSWIRQLFARPVSTIRKAPPRARPAVEELENRWVPSIVVNNPTDTPVAGQTDLRQAIEQANATPGGDTITFDSTVFATPQTITLGGTQLELSNTTGAETITGPAAGVTVSGGGLSRVFQVDAGVTASLSGLTITDGNASSGGGLYNLGTATLTDCTVSGNTTTGNGGGIYSNHATITLNYCTISGNTAGVGNSRSFGGGLLSIFGTATLTDCTVSGNTARGGGGGGGGVYLYGAGFTNTLTGCTISGNSVPGSGASGGGVQIGTSTTTLTDCTISGNSVGFNGGGLADYYGGMTTLINCTVSGNSSAVTGGGLAFGAGLTGGTITLGNTIVAGNTAVTGPDVFGAFTSKGHNLIGETDGSSGWVSSDLTGTVASPLNAIPAAGLLRRAY